MSYLENGSTHRSMFRMMPPHHHDADPNRSQVLAHIMANMQCDIGRAMAAFNSMRNPKSRVLVFDHIHRMWKGCDWQASDDDAAKGMILSELRALQRRVVGMDSELRKTVKELKRVRKELADLYTDSQPSAEGAAGDDDDTESTQVDDEYPGFIPQINMEEANRIALIAQEKRQKELEAEQKENLRKAMMICR